MKYRTLGRTGFNVSALSYGGSSLGSVFREIDEKEGIKTVQNAFDSGINYFDCSPFYGLTEAERIMGMAIKGFPRDQYLLSSKAGRYGWNEFDFSFKRIIQSAEESMKRLNVEYLDILNLHDIEYNNCAFMHQALNEGIPALKKLKEQGKIRFFGIAVYPLQVIRDVIDLHDVDIVMNHNLFTLTDTRLLDLLHLIKEKNIGLVNSAPLGSGLLTSRGVASWHPAGDKERSIISKAVKLCEKNGTSLEKLAIQFSVSCEEIPTTLISTANPERIILNAQYVNEDLNITLVEEVREVLKPLQNKDWDDFKVQDLNTE
jgi:aryl-alcohol dehydrogenase-like predicted oxidoreductase